MSGLTASGLVIPTQDEILESLQTYLRAQPGWSGVDVSEDSVAGQLLRAVAEQLYDLYGILDQVYRSLDATTATGSQLDRLAALAGLVRRPATYSTVTLRCSGTGGTVIPAGSQAAIPGGTTWETTADGTIDAVTGYVDVPARCTTAGAEVAAAGSITQIVTPVSGWTGVTNPADATVGRDEESDAELRERLIYQGVAAGAGSVEAISARIQNLTAVQDGVVWHNPRDYQDPNTGLAAHSLRIVVYPDLSADVDALAALKAAIWGDAGVPAGVSMVGAQSATYYDSEHDVSAEIRWDWASEVRTYLYVLVGSYTSDFPISDWDSRAWKIIQDYYAGLGIGDDVLPDALEAAIMTGVPGIRQIEVRASRAGPPGAGDAGPVSIGLDEIATIQNGDVDYDA